MASRVNDDNRLGMFYWAVALTLGGIALLLFNLEVFSAYEPVIQYVLAAILAAGSVAFFGSYLSRRQNWWRLIPAWTLLALAGMVYLSAQTLDQRLTAALLFVGQALAFAHIYLLDRSERWWAVIPGGFMLVVGGVIALSSRTEDPETLGTLLFVGMGGVFFLLYLLGERRRLWWALIPGAVLVLFGIFVFSLARTSESVLLRWWPLLLILLGIGLGWRAYTQQSRQKLSVNSAPNMTRRSTRGGKATATSSRSGHLGEYHEPAPGSSVEVLPDPDEEK